MAEGEEKAICQCEDGDGGSTAPSFFPQKKLSTFCLFCPPSVGVGTLELVLSLLQEQQHNSSRLRKTGESATLQLFLSLDS